MSNRRNVIVFACGIALALGAMLGGSSLVAQVNNPGLQQFGAVTKGHYALWGDGTGQLKDGGAPPASFVTSWNARTGAVLPATNDYNFNQLAGSAACSQLPAWVGNVTSSAGSCTTVLSALTGDITTTGGGGAGGLATTLATVNANVGSFGSATQCLTLTVNAKGLVTAASAATCTPAFSSLTGSAACSQLPALTGDATTSAGSCATTVVKVNGIAYSATGAAHSVPVITSANTTATYKALTDCTGTGKAVTFAKSTDAFGCNTIAGSGALNGSYCDSVTANACDFTTSVSSTTATIYKITLCGGGGGGGGVAQSASFTASGAGGAGGCAIYYCTNVAASTAISITIGAAGTAGSSGNNVGGTGGNSSLTCNGNALTASGGVGGNGSAAGNATGGAGGAASGGTINIAGNPGGLGQTNGSNVLFGGLGGGTSLGAGGTPGTGAGAGGSATGCGGGGGGTIDANAGAKAGGAGFRGCRLIEYVL